MRWPALVLVLLMAPAGAVGLEVCRSVPVYEPCEISFDMTPAELDRDLQDDLMNNMPPLSQADQFRDPLGPVSERQKRLAARGTVTASPDIFAGLRMRVSSSSK